MLKARIRPSRGRGRRTAAGEGAGVWGRSPQRNSQGGRVGPSRVAPPFPQAYVVRLLCLLALLALASLAACTAPPDDTAPAPAATWRGLTIAGEDRCSPYDSDDYSYPQSVEPRIVEGMGGIVYGPYTGRRFDSTRETDIEHIVARSEAHDSGLCAADDDTRARFSADLLNLTLASPEVNREQKRAYDAAEWLPQMNRCWYADRIVQVRQKYALTIDRAEADALERVLSGCASVDMVVR